HRARLHLAHIAVDAGLRLFRSDECAGRVDHGGSRADYRRAGRCRATRGRSCGATKDLAELRRHARSVRAGKTEQTGDHEQAGTRLGDDHEADPDVAGLEQRTGAALVRRSKVAHDVTDRTAADPATRAADNRLVPLVDVAALVKRAVRARRAGVAALD